MPDITMCTNHTCPLKGNCYRYKAIPNAYGQSYQKFIYNRKLNKKPGCEYFIEYKTKINE